MKIYAIGSLIFVCAMVGMHTGCSARMPADQQFFGYVNKSGKLAFPAHFHEAYDFSEGVAAVRTERNIHAVWRFIDKTGRVQLSCSPVIMRVLNFSEDLAGAQTAIPSKNAATSGSISTRVSHYNGVNQGKTEAGASWGFIDRKGNFVIQPQFESVGPFKNGLAPARMAGKWGYINKSGKFVIKPQFDRANDFSEGLAAVSKEEKYGFIDTNGTTKIPFQFQMVQDFHNKVAAVCDDGWYPIDQSGKKLAGDAKFKGYRMSSDHLYPTHDSYHSVQEYDPKSKKFVVTKAGDYIFYQERSSDTGVPIGFMNQDGSLAFTLPPSFLKEEISVRDFDHGIAIIIVGDQTEQGPGKPPTKTYYLCNKTGKLTKVNALQLSTFSEGLAQALRAR